MSPLERIGHHNYELNSATILRDVYRLLAMVVADQTIAMLATDADDPLARLRNQFIEDELVHLLIGTAVVNRSQDDHMRELRADEGEFSFQPANFDCGILQPNILEDVEVPLSFREACNKIIHAVQIAAEGEDREGAAFSIMPPGIVLRGHQNKKAWSARLSLIEYARASVKNFMWPA
jgi:hypothetical protein